VLISTPQTVSIALGAALVAVVDYRLLVVAEAVAVALCAVYLLTRPRLTEEVVDDEPALAA
ncbi:MAG TPA: hypothetical protein VIZ44_06150, partial [Gaiellaceae bacterium]